jgi:hypothetical protein
LAWPTRSRESTAVTMRSCCCAPAIATATCAANISATCSDSSLNSVDLPAVQVQRAEVVALDGQLDRQHAADTELGGSRVEVGPAAVAGDVGQPQRLLLVEAVQARALAGLVLRLVHPALDPSGPADSLQNRRNLTRAESARPAPGCQPGCPPPSS